MMTHDTAVKPKKRINSIDALRTFALFGILSFHCMEHFDLMYTPTIDSPFWQSIDHVVFDTLSFLFAGKSYAIFSLLFGLSFFMQMDSQAKQGSDFRWRFVWRLILLLGLGYLNGLIYMGEFFVVYAFLGIIMIPLYKVPTKWLIVLNVLLFMQIPDLIQFVSLFSNATPNEPSLIMTYMNKLYENSNHVFLHGSFTDVLSLNVWKGQLSKLLWVINSTRYSQMIGLFVTGLLIGRSGVYKNEEKIVKYSNKALPYSIAFFVVIYAVYLLLPAFGVEGFALYFGKTLFRTYSNLGLMMVYVCSFMLLYYKTNFRKTLDKAAPMGRMSVTNYMGQSIMGVCLFYGFGANLAAQCSFLECFLVGLVIFSVQVTFSYWWMKRFYYGPLEWLWRTMTWFKPIPLKRK